MESGGDHNRDDQRIAAVPPVINASAECADEDGTKFVSHSNPNHLRCEFEWIHPIVPYRIASGKALCSTLDEPPIHCGRTTKE